MHLGSIVVVNLEGKKQKERSKQYAQSNGSAARIEDGRLRIQGGFLQEDSQIAQRGPGVPALEAT